MTTVLLRLCISCYSSVVAVGMLLVRLCVSRAPFARGWNLAERSNGPCPKHPGFAKETVWIHAASLGESKILVRFLDILRHKHPGRFYLITATTKTGVDYLRRACGDDDDIAAVGFLPIDTIGRMRRLIRTFGVRRAWVMETELWPCMLWTCMRMSVPLGLVNARIEERSLSSYRRMAWLLSPLLCFPDIVLAQNEQYAGRFERLGISRQRIRITGNMKSYVTIHPQKAEERAKLRSPLLLDNNDLCMTAGCLHVGEGLVLREALDIVRKSGVALRCIVVPRHLRESQTLARELGPGTVVVQEPSAAAPWDICLIDKMGILDAMYRIADAAFIGGTFDTTGGHNMWDAAQFGIPVLFGPDIHTQQESGRALLSAGVGFGVSGAEELAAALVASLRDAREQFLRSRDAFMSKISRQSNTIEDVIP
jgi:3-deoxy-D-manno-octulosonic-acid transferase